LEVNNFLCFLYRHSGIDREKEYIMANYIFKDNSKDAGSFTHVPSTRKYNDDEMLGAGAALIIGGLLGAAAVAAAADDEIRREAEVEREAKRRADEIRREAERAARRAAYGMTKDEVVHEVVKYCMKEQLSDKMVVMTAIVRELMETHGATIQSIEAQYGELRMKGYCSDFTDLRITLSSIGRITVDAYEGRLIRYSSSNKVFKEYVTLVDECNKTKFDKLARVMSY
jgi:hypothetical protein